MGAFSKKSLDELQAEAERGVLRRSLGPLNLTALGIGSIIGTGIFVLTGTAASQNAGPALVISMIISAVGCAFAGLCYAELAAMIPVAGSAYTYAYATVGQLVAWIIGWDLILEYALSASTIAVGWSGYFVSLMHDLGVACHPRSRPPAAPGRGRGRRVSRDLQPARRRHRAAGDGAARASASRSRANANTALVVIKVSRARRLRGGGRRLRPARAPDAVRAAEHRRRSATFGWSGVLRGAGVMFFAYIGFDAVSTAAQEAKNPQRDMPIGILASLAICTVLYIAVAIVLHRHRALPAAQRGGSARRRHRRDRSHLASPVRQSRARSSGLFSTMLVQLLGQTRIFYSMSRDGLLPHALRRACTRASGRPTSARCSPATIVALAAGLLPIGVAQPAGEHRDAAGVRARLSSASSSCAARRPMWPGRSARPACRGCRSPARSSAWRRWSGLPIATWERLIIWLAIGLVIYASYGARHAMTSSEPARSGAIAAARY